MLVPVSDTLSADSQPTQGVREDFGSESLRALLEYSRKRRLTTTTKISYSTRDKIPGSSIVSSGSHRPPTLALPHLHIPREAIENKELGPREPRVGWHQEAWRPGMGGQEWEDQQVYQL